MMVPFNGSSSSTMMVIEFAAAATSNIGTISLLHVHNFSSTLGDPIILLVLLSL